MVVEMVLGGKWKLILCLILMNMLILSSKCVHFVSNDYLIIWGITKHYARFFAHHYSNGWCTRWDKATNRFNELNKKNTTCNQAVLMTELCWTIRNAKVINILFDSQSSQPASHSNRCWRWRSLKSKHAFYHPHTYTHKKYTLNSCPSWNVQLHTEVVHMRVGNNWGKTCVERILWRNQRLNEVYEFWCRMKTFILLN